jgi:hypothetical protein
MLIGAQPFVKPKRGNPNFFFPYPPTHISSASIFSFPHPENKKYPKSERVKPLWVGGWEIKPKKKSPE